MMAWRGASAVVILLSITPASGTSVCVCVCVCGDASASGVEGRLPSLFEVCRFLQCKDRESSQRISSETLFRPVRRLTLGLPRSKVVHC